ncbi:RAQPRD family integrative conjugative element protein [Pseudomonas azerbaijanoccidens]|uniref:integrative conjugative element protein, RAQPRD family n=1 Tax=Pseudomonas azerbaijanoccidentalis TaxID=2842347 RepID=UPI00200A375D|nr:RAQPRD family integrative conjugative element protein [Pseudomonas azerbaijanoccidentalis]MCK8663713.1 RAQPRD family integrative conjugative element protein [Pseudomonas azerbaijanoccidentalis]
MSTTAFRCFLLLSLTIVHGSSFASSLYEQDQLNLVIQQLGTIERLVTRAEVASASEPNKRYRFDYPHLIQDIQRIHRGVKDYLSPSRAQPRDSSELVGDYRLDTPTAEPSP